jgi:hypothetical protein
MIHLALVCSALLAETPNDILEDYRAAASQVGRDAEAHVKLALWCEAHGLGAERLRHLAIAVLTDPANATARGLMGLVAYRGKWQRPDAVAEQVKADEATAAALAEYNARRIRTPDTADAQWKLALWCEENGLKAEATAHLAAVVRLDPSREAAWKRMGYRKHDGRWMTEEQAAAEKAEEDRQHLANRIWKPKLEKWRGWLTEKTPRRELAERRLAEVADPRAVPAVWAVFATGDAARQAVAAQLFGQIDAPAASHSLVFLATLGKAPEVRRRAAETLSRRDPRDVVGLLIDFFRDPVTYQVKPVDGPGSTGILLVEGKKFNVRRRYTLPSLPQQTLRFLEDPSLITRGSMVTRTVQFDPSPTTDGSRSVPSNNGVMVTSTLVPTGAVARRGAAVDQNLDEARRAAAAARQQMLDDINEVESYNRDALAMNATVETVLKSLTGRDLGQDGEAWRRWWAEEQGYGYAETSQPLAKPTFDQQVPLNYVPQFAVLRDCFGAGTLVQTREGARPIEAIRAGDVVLSQDTKTGRLSFEPVLVVHHDKPAPMLRIDLGGEAVVSTGIHRFWRPGKGWAMARDLKPGDSVRTLGGRAQVAAVETAPEQPTFNLEVGGGRSFFVGKAGVLVHDKGPVQPEPDPFDAEPSLEAIATSDPSGR